VRREDYDAIFEAEVANLLAPNFRRSGKSLFLIAGSKNLSLVRLGGRFAPAGKGVYMAGFRFAFMRDESGRQKDHFVGSPLSYLSRLQASSLAPTGSSSWRPVTTENKGSPSRATLFRLCSPDTCPRRRNDYE
jgi:hypothetical protein